MPSITTGDIKLLKSQVMDDVPEGGGAPTATAIVDAASNSIFPDISELDRAGGRVNLRKVHIGVRTNDVEGFYGVNLIVAEPPQDPRVSITLFSTGEVFDRRSSAASRLESYLAKGATYSGYLFGDHIAGQRSFTLLQRLGVSLPAVGETYVLTKNQGLSTAFDQFVRVTDVSALERTFNDGSGDFTRMQVTLDISDALQQDFNGFDALRLDSSVNYTNKTKICATIVADAAQYFGVVKLQNPGVLGDFTIKATGIHTQLVPSTRIEVPIADARMNQQSATLVSAGEAYSRTIISTFATGNAMFVGGGILPGSLSVTRAGIVVTDKGGLLVDATGGQVGTVDYASGVLALSTNVFGATAGSHAVSYTPAYQPTLVSQSLAEPVTIAGQRLSWVLTLDPPPARGTLQVSYRALGRWYDLREDGSGAIRGADSSFGAGSLNYTTGTVSVSLGALPDVESALVYTFVPSAVTRALTDTPSAGPTLPRALGSIISVERAIKPGTLSVTWNDGTARTATDTGGTLTGDATGAISYAEGLINFRPNLLPASGTTINVSITETVQQKATVGTFIDGGAAWTATLTAPLKANSVELSIIGQFNLDEPAAYWLARGAPQLRSIRLFDNGSGSLLMANIDTNIVVGTVNYATGAISIDKTIAGFKVDAIKYRGAAIGSNGGSVLPQGYEITTTPLTVLNGPGAGSAPALPGWGWWASGQSNALEARYAGSDASAYDTSFALTNLFLPANAAPFSETSGFAAKFSSFFIGSSLYALSAGDGLWKRDPAPATGVGTTAGANAVVAGMSGVLITSWPTGAPSAPTGLAGATQPVTTGIGALLSVDRATFRTAVSPLINAGFNIAGNWTPTGVAFSVTADTNGLLSSGSAPVGETPGSFGVFGKVDYEMGLVNVAFGRRVPASMAGDDLVIDISDLGIAGVDYIESIPVQSDTLRYNAVGQSYLPLDPDILGLNPVRLPADGRVPIFRPGTFAVVGHTGTVPAATYTAGQTVDCARVRLSRVRMIGNDGLVIAGGYTADLDTGLVAIDDVTGWSQPVIVEHRIEDMMLVSDAQINGQLSFTRPLTHDYPAPGSYVSSALVAGDVRARTSLVFDQQTWSNDWLDSVDGDPATGTFNDALNPIVVTNRSALTERWAAVFDNTTSFKVIGEHIGVVAIGNIGADCAPNNPATGLPYFTIPSVGWGLGWSAGNVLRFNTVGALVPAWIARTILQGPATVGSDSWTALIRGDVDRP